MAAGSVIRAPHSDAIERDSRGPVYLTAASTTRYEIRTWQTAKRSVHVVALLAGTEASFSVEYHIRLVGVIAHALAVFVQNKAFVGAALANSRRAARATC